jgi:hypothetical protein
MNKRPLILIAAVAAIALLAAELLAVGIRRSAPGGSDGASAARSGTVSRAPSLPRAAPPTVTRAPAASPQVRPPTVARPPVAAAPRTNITARDWSYPRSSGGTPRSTVGAAPRVVTPTPGRAAVVPARPNLPAPVAGGVQYSHRPGALGINPTRDANRQMHAREPYVNLNGGARGGSATWARDAANRGRVPAIPRSGPGFGHRLDRHWDANARQQLARSTRSHLQHGYTYFRPGWRGYTRGWVGGARWAPWQNYWSWRGWQPYHWWRAPAWGGLATFIPGTAWSTYIPYDYGDNIIYQNNVVYQNGQQLATAEDYAAQAMQLANADVPPPPQLPEYATATPDAASGDWQPLGVFALTTDENAAPTTFLQLAVSRQGYISGTYFNQLTGETLPVAGSVDRRTQRAAWRIDDNQTTVMEAGLYNLTQEQAPLLIHFGKDETEDYLLVRMQQPPEGTVPQSADLDDFDD